MSYTLTLDMPKKTAAYVERRGPRYRAELNAIFVAIVTANMQNDEDEARREEQETACRPSLVDIFRSCPKDVDLGALIPPRSRSSGRAHPVDFAALLQEEA